MNKAYKEGFLGERHSLKSGCELFCFVSQNCKLQPYGFSSGEG